MEYAVRIILIIFAVVGITFFIKSKDRYRFIISDTFWVIVPWTLCLFMYYFSGIHYQVKLEWYVFLYILLFWGSYFLGKCCYKRVHIKILGEDKKRNKIGLKVNRQKLNLKPLFYFSLISVIIYSIYMVSLNQIILGQTRTFNTNGFATALLICSSSSLVIWLYELSYALVYDKKVSWYAYFCMIIFNIPGFITSGRDALLIFIISTCIVLIYSGNVSKKIMKNKGKTYSSIKKKLLLSFIPIMIYLVFLTSSRYGISAIKQFMWAGGCTFPSYLEFIYYNLGGLGKLILNAVFYYSSQFSKLSLIFQNYKGPYLGGLYQLHYISRLLPTSWNLNYTLVIEGIAEAVNNSNVPGMRPFWETVIGYFIYDFGRYGAITMSFVLGIVIQWIKQNIMTLKSILNILIYAFISLGFFIAIQFSPFFDYYFIFPLFWIIVLKLYVKNKYKKEIPKKESRL
ncbi:MAG: oligosaccharide repeat unit polymerase [Bacilli bacterium]|nr:oligosaccharide repeat unit polymerase [Bacilli bacterium]MBR1817280.1 oligosaccharide repeat unit polymerase [Bacilli bacterium]